MLSSINNFAVLRYHISFQLDKLRKGEGIVKDEVDTALLANTYDPDTNKSGKTNKKRQKENVQLRKGESKI